jgi:hypothetical protein
VEQPKEDTTTVKAPSLTLSNLYKKHLKKRMSSVVYRLFETPVEIKPITMATIMLRNMSQKSNQPINEPERWIEIFSTFLQKRDIFCEQNYELELLFAELSLFHDTRMLSYSLSLLNRVYG